MVSPLTRFSTCIGNLRSPPLQDTKFNITPKGHVICCPYCPMSSVNFLLLYNHMTNLNQTCHECSLCGTLQRMSFWWRSKMQHGCQDQECILIGQKLSSQISRFDCDIVGIIIKWACAIFECFMSIKKPRWPLTPFLYARLEMGHIM